MVTSFRTLEKFPKLVALMKLRPRSNRCPYLHQGCFCVQLLSKTNLMRFSLFSRHPKTKKLSFRHRRCQKPGKNSNTAEGPRFQPPVYAKHTNTISYRAIFFKPPFCPSPSPARTMFIPPCIGFQTIQRVPEAESCDILSVVHQREKCKKY